MTSWRSFFVIFTLVIVTACVPQRNRMNMVTDKETGLLYGSTIEQNLLTDATFYNNRKIKVRARNTSGDTAFNLREFTSQLEDSYRDKGYTPTTAEDFGLLVDVNVMYSGHIQTNLASEFGFLSAGIGQAYGTRGGRTMGPLVGAVAGAGLGTIIGANITEDTYIIVAQVSFGVVKKAKKSRKRITFSRSQKIKNIDDPDEDDKVYNRGFKKTHTTHLSVYAGGRNVEQLEITSGVKQRFARIIGDFI